MSNCHDGIAAPPGYRALVMGYPDLYKLALSVGLPPEKADIAAAIALAESRGRTGAVHVGDNGEGQTDCNSYGLWQIQSCCKRDKVGVRVDKSKLLTAEGSAAAMMNISGSGKNWGPWTTYRNGAYRAFLKGGGGGTRSTIVEGGGGATNPIELDLDVGQTARDTTKDIPIIGGAVNAVVTGAEVLAAFGSFAARLIDPTTWSRVAYMIGGGALVVVAIVVINRDTIATGAMAATGNPAAIAAIAS